MARPARRASSDNALNRADIHVLDSLAIRVRPDLATELHANGKVIVTIPFRAGGMQHDIRAPDHAQARRELDALATPAGIADETLYLLAQDGVDDYRVITGEFAGELGDIVIVQYAIVNDRFEVQFRQGDCCGSSRFLFARRQPAR